MALAGAQHLLSRGRLLLPLPVPCRAVARRVDCIQLTKTTTTTVTAGAAVVVDVVRGRHLGDE